MNTKAVGEKTEGQVLAALLRAGKIVLLPFGDNQRYDMVVDEDRVFIRIQCKTARLLKDGSILDFQTCSSSVHRGGSKRGYRGEVDLFGVYSPDLDKVYFVPVDDVGERGCILRLKRPENNQITNVRWASDYEFDHNGVVDRKFGLPIKDRIVQPQFEIDFTGE